MNNENQLSKKDEDLDLRKAQVENAELSDADLENISGGFLDAHGDVCVSVGAGMSTVTTGGTNKNNG